MSDLSFTSLGQSIFGKTSTLVDSSETFFYIVGTDRVLQIEGVVIRPSNNNNFIHTILASNLNNTSFASLISNSYSSSIMNKFSTFPNSSINSIISFIKNNSSGYEETNTFSQGFRPLFGWSNGTNTTTTNYNYNAVGQCVQTTQTCRPRDYYFLGIHLIHQDRCDDPVQIIMSNSSQCEGPIGGYH